MDLNLDEIEKALGEATQGKWGKHENPHIKSAINCGDKHIAMVNYSHRGLPGDVFGVEHEANAHLIANAPEWLRLLVERVRELEKVAEAARVVAQQNGEGGICDLDDALSLLDKESA